MNSAFHAIWLVPRSRNIKWHSSHKPVSPEQRIVNTSQLFSGSRDHGFCMSYTGFVMFVLHQDVVWKVFHFAWNPKGLARYKSVFSWFLVLYCRHIFAWVTFVYDWMSDMFALVLVSTFYWISRREPVNNKPQQFNRVEPRAEQPRRRPFMGLYYCKPVAFSAHVLHYEFLLLDHPKVSTWHFFNLFHSRERRVEYSLAICGQLHRLFMFTLMWVSALARKRPSKAQSKLLFFVFNFQSPVTVW